MTIVARLDGQGNVLDFMDWRDATLLPANVRLATAGEIQALQPSAPLSALAQLEVNDAFMFRALEVLIDILIAKGTIVATDVTPAIRTLYQNRKALRVTAGVP